MDTFGTKQNLQASTRRVISRGHQKDLWFVVQEGSLSDVDAALALLKKSGGNINARNTFGLTALHIATWRNHIPIVRRLLVAGADPDARDGESGWCGLHRALHFGHLAVASILLQSGASITLEDSKLRTPIDLLSGPVLQTVGKGHDTATEVFSWGSGANYQLGTGNACIQKLPCKVDCLHDSSIKLISAAKFHSIAITDRGEVFSWGFGRGGRLGHPDFDIHSGQAAVITPRQVTFGLGSRCVKAVAAAKHHTVIATESGEVFTWGSNREGQLGYTSVDTQPTPRRVSSLRSKVVAVAAANKHTAVVTELGEVFTWGCNEEGQLGYGTSNSGSNSIPRVVEYLKGKVYMGVAAAKYHTIALGADGEVNTWGHRLVIPRRVVVARNLKKSGCLPLKFHRVQKLHVKTVAAGMVHSLALADDGSLFYWKSSDPDLRCQQLYSLCQRNFVSISAGKYWAAAVTTTGDVYMWDGKKDKDKLPSPVRLHGMKKATSVAVGETHLLIVGSLYHPAYACKMPDNPPKPALNGEDPMDELTDDILFGEMETDMLSSIARVDESACRPSVPSLKSLCEKKAAECLVEPRNAMQLLEIADSLEAVELRKHCEDIVIRNLDYIFAISPQSIASASLDVLVKLEKLLDLKSSEAWSYRRLPTPTATFPAVINSEEEDSDNELLKTRVVVEKSAFNNHKSCIDSYFLTEQDSNEQVIKQIRALHKKLQQVEMLEEKQSKGHRLDNQQIAKLQTKSILESSLTELGVPMEELHEKPLASESTEGKGRNVGMSRKQKKKGKKQPLQAENSPSDCREEDKLTLEGKCQEVEATMECCKDVGFFPTKDEISVSQEKPFSSVVKESWNDEKVNSREFTKGKNAKPSEKKKIKKGGLSMFLSGALDDLPKEAAPPLPLPKSEGPAWGGAKLPKGSTSLREILDEQKTNKDISPITGSRAKQVEVADVNKGEERMNLSLLVPSSPISVRQPSHGLDADRGTPPWASSGTPPLASRPSLRDIQLQQQGGKQQQALSPSPKMRTSGFAIASGQGSPSDTAGMNHWFKPEAEATSSIRAIQIEEKAMKDLKRFYSSVKIVKNHN